MHWRVFFSLEVVSLPLKSHKNIIKLQQICFRDLSCNLTDSEAKVILASDMVVVDAR